jgi:hypothetical protein
MKGIEMAVNRLGMLNYAKLIPLIESQFTSSKLDDGGFAAKATQELGFAVSREHVRFARSELGIKAYKDQAKKDDLTSLAARVAVLEKQVDDLLDLRRELLGIKK